jgi:hypothetical protein
MGTVASRVEAINFPLPFFLFSGMKAILKEKIVDESPFYFYVYSNGRLVPLRKDKVIVK